MTLKLKLFLIFSAIVESGALSTVPQERNTLLDLLPTSGFIGSSSDEVTNICQACTDLEIASISSLSGNGKSQLNGKWRLRFTSASPYGLLRSLPISSSLPESLRKGLIDDSLLLASSVEQTIDSTNNRMINTVDLSPWRIAEEEDNSNNPLASLLSSIPGPVGQALDSLKSATVRLEFDHLLENNNESSKRSDLKLEKIRRSLQGAGESLPSFIPKETSYNLPLALSGSFETIYVDSSLRIVRGTSFPFQDEILVFERDGAPPTEMEVPEGCEIEYEEDGRMVMRCEGEEEGAMPSD